MGQTSTSSRSSAKLLFVVGRLREGKSLSEAVRSIINGLLLSLMLLALVKGTPENGSSS
jgi:hypothetical protein